MRMITGRGGGLIVAALLVTAVLTAGCTSGAAKPVATPLGPPTYQGSGRPELTTTRVTLSKRLLVTRLVERATVIGDVIVLAGRDKSDYGAIAAVDLTTGEPLWQGHKILDDLPIARGPASVSSADGWAVDDGRGGIVVEEYYRNPCPADAGLCHERQTTYTEEFGLVALSVKDRSVRWSVPILPRLKRTDPKSVEYDDQHLKVVAATAEVVVVNIGGDPIYGTGMEGGHPRTIGVDPRTGKKLWTVEDTLTQVALEGRLLAVRQQSGAGGSDSLPVALDPRTGRELWQLPEKTSGTWTEAAGDLALVRHHSDDGKVSFQLVGTDNGRLGPRLSEGATSFLAVGTNPDGKGYAAWVTSGHYRLMTQGLTDPKPLIAKRPMPELLFAHGAGDGYVWLSVPGADHQGLMAVDRTGAVRSEELTGYPRVVVEGLVVTDGGLYGENGVGIWRYR